MQGRSIGVGALGSRALAAALSVSRDRLPPLLALFRCHACSGKLEVLPCQGSTHEQSASPIIRAIPRTMGNADQLFPSFYARYGLAAGNGLPTQIAGSPLKKSRPSTGHARALYQWTLVSEMVIDFRESSLRSIHPLDESFFLGKVGLDAGCGSSAC